MEDLFARQRAAVEREPYPAAAVRKDRIRRALDVTVLNQQRTNTVFEEHELIVG